MKKKKKTNKKNELNYIVKDIQYTIPLKILQDPQITLPLLFSRAPLDNLQPILVRQIYDITNNLHGYYNGLPLLSISFGKFVDFLLISTHFNIIFLCIIFPFNF